MEPHDSTPAIATKFVETIGFHRPASAETDQLSPLSPTRRVSTAKSPLLSPLAGSPLSPHTITQMVSKANGQPGKARRRGELEEDALFGLKKVVCAPPNSIVMACLQQWHLMRTSVLFGLQIRVLSRQASEEQVMLGLHALLAFTTIEGNLPKMTNEKVVELIFELLYAANDVPTEEEMREEQELQQASLAGGRRPESASRRNSSKRLTAPGVDSGTAATTSNRRGSLMGGLFERRKSYSPEDSSPPVHSDQSQPRPQSSNPFERRASMLRPPFADAPKKKAKKQTMAPEVTTMLLQCLFNLTMTPASHIKLIAPDRMRILSWFLGAEMFKHRMLALRTLSRRKQRLIVDNIAHLFPSELLFEPH